MKDDATVHHGEKVLKTFEGYGSILGFGVGLLGALLITGPHFHEWSVTKCLSFLIGGAAVGAVVGFILPKMSLGFAAGAKNSNYSDISNANALLNEHHQNGNGLLNENHHCHDHASYHSSGDSSVCSHD